MIITDEQVVEILKKEVMEDTEVGDLIVKYVFDKKGINIGRIKRPDNQISLLLFQNAQTIVCDHYTKKFMSNDTN